MAMEDDGGDEFAFLREDDDGRLMLAIHYSQRAQQHLGCDGELAQTHNDGLHNTEYGTTHQASGARAGQATIVSTNTRDDYNPHVRHDH